MSKIIHSIISWDCSFRNFFHTIDGILNQDYDLSQVEFIYVEQRSKEYANNYNHKFGLKTLSDRYNELNDSQLNFYVEYLNDDPSIPYHLGRSNNKGIEKASGKIISVMDGDMLLPPLFLKELEEYHSEGAGVVNIVRRMAERPVDVSFDNWTEATFDYEKCLNVCPDRNQPIPKRVSNKGPMISALKEHWVKVNGYDENKIWSTGLSRLGQDVNSRLETVADKESTALPNLVAVHPYHPSGFSRTTFDSARILSLQQNLIEYAEQYKIYNWLDRSDITEKVEKRNEDLINRIHNKENEVIYSDNELLGKFYLKLRKVLSELSADKKVKLNI